MKISFMHNNYKLPQKKDIPQDYEGDQHQALQQGKNMYKLGTL